MMNRDTNLVHSQQRRDHLVNFQISNMSPHTEVVSTAKLVHAPVHALDFLDVIDQPSLGPVEVGICPKHLAIALHHPRIASNDRAARYENPADGGAGGGDNPFVHGAERRMHTEGFLDACRKVWKALRFCEAGESYLRHLPLGIGNVGWL